MLELLCKRSLRYVACMLRRSMLRQLQTFLCNRAGADRQEQGHIQVRIDLYLSVTYENDGAPAAPSPPPIYGPVCMPVLCLSAHGTGAFYVFCLAYLALAADDLAACQSRLTTACHISICHHQAWLWTFPVKQLVNLAAGRTRCAAHRRTCAASYGLPGMPMLCLSQPMPLLAFHVLCLAQLALTAGDLEAWLTAACHSSMYHHQAWH